MGKRLNGKALSKFEGKRDVWQEAIKAGGGKRTKVKAKSIVTRVDEERKRTKKSRNKGLVKLLLSCPAKHWFQPLDRVETIDDIKLPKLV
jgi:hypothetical protein